MQTSGANELGYANTALLLALFDVLVEKGILATADLDTITTRAIGELEPTRNIRSVNGAIGFINSLLPEIRKSGAK